MSCIEINIDRLMKVLYLLWIENALANDYQQ